MEQTVENQNNIIGKVNKESLDFKTNIEIWKKCSNFLILFCDLFLKNFVIKIKNMPG